MNKLIEKLKLILEEQTEVVALLFVVFLGLILRLIGIRHGFPFIFHPDEPTIIRSALGIRFDPNPKHFDWPHLYIYVNYFLYMFFAKLRSFIAFVGLRDKSALWMPLIWNEGLIYYYLTRCLSAILGALTAIPVYLAGKKLFGKKAGILGAFAIAIMPYHVWHSHYALGDVPMSFLISWALYFSTLIIKNDRIKNYIFSGLFIGLAASVKYNGGLIAPMVPLAHFFKVFWKRGTSKKKKKKVRLLDVKGILNLFSSGLAAFLGFLAGTPYALLDFKTFSGREYGRGAFWQFENVGSVSFYQHFMDFFTEGFCRLLMDTGYVVIPVFFGGLIYLIYILLKKKMGKRDYYLGFFYLITIFLIWYLSGFKNDRSHYYFIVYPYLAIIFGYFVYSIQDRLIPHLLKLKNEKSIKIISSVFVLLIFSPLFIKSSINSYRYYRGDTRNLLHKWLIANYDPSETIVYDDRALKDIFGNTETKAYKGLENFDDFDKVLIVIIEPNGDDREFLDKNESKLEEVVRFESKLRLGDDIEVYRYVEPSNPLDDCGCGK